MAITVLLFLFWFAVVVKSADFATKRSTELARTLRLSTYTIGFLIIAVISILPEAAVAVTSAIQNTPSLGLGTLFGSNVIDLTIVFALITLASRSNVKVESKILKDAPLYIGAIAFALLFGLNGHYSRVEGVALILIGTIFYFFALSGKKHRTPGERALKEAARPFAFLLTSMALLIIASNYTVRYAIALANNLGVAPVFIGMFIISAGTVLPELLFSLRAVRKDRDSLALGDLLGTVITDATIVVGAVAIIRPFAFNPRIIYITGVFMLLAAILLFHLMKTGKALTRKEAAILLIFYAAFLAAEFAVLCETPLAARTFTTYCAASSLEALQPVL